MTAQIVSERVIIIELLQLYKDLPSLWDTAHQFYNNKESREQGYELLLEKYKILQSDATKDSVKKKIEHMRAAYRREYKKVVAARMNHKVHSPSLWYYNYLAFLDHNPEVEAEICKKEKQPQFPEYEELDEVYLQNSTTSEDEEPPLKQPKLSSVFIEENFSQDISNKSFNSASYKRGAEAFGKVVGYQLSELNPLQRTIAEKLISDVIYHGRLDRLKTKSTISLNDE